MQVEKVIDAAKANGVALEINSQPYRLDLCDSHARLARDRGVKLVIDSDAHYTDALDYPQVGNPDRAPGLGDEGRRAQYAAPEAIQEVAAQKSVASP